MRFWGYRDRAGEDVQEVPVVHDVGLTQADVDTAYEKGRRDERARRRGHPFLTLVVVLLALVGVATLFFAAREGSFAAGGQAMDVELAAATGQAQVASQNAVQSAREQLHRDTASR
jgi:heme A synthase